MRPHSITATLIMACIAVVVSICLTLPAKKVAADDPVLSVTGTLPYAEAGSEATYHIELLNHTNHIVYDGVISITLPAGFSYVPSSILVMGQGWPLESREPLVNGQTLTWGPYHTRKQSATGGLRVGQDGTIYALNDHRLEIYR